MAVEAPANRVWRSVPYAVRLQKNIQGALSSDDVGSARLFRLASASLPEARPTIPTHNKHLGVLSPLLSAEVSPIDKISTCRANWCIPDTGLGMFFLSSWPVSGAVSITYHRHTFMVLYVRGVGGPTGVPWELW